MAKPIDNPTPEQLKRREYQREWNRKNREKRNAASLRHYHENKDYYADWHLQDKYGISLEEKRALYVEQSGQCAICHDGEATELDHCHTSGAVRGLLCTACNTGLGLFKDNQAALGRAIEYLNAANARTACSTQAAA